MAICLAIFNVLLLTDAGRMLHCIYMNNDKISWRAPEHEHREHDADWYWAVGIITLSLAVVFFIFKNIFLSIIVVLGVGILFAHSKTPPRTIECALSRKGIRVNTKLYTWESLESFWILEERFAGKMHVGAKILLISKKPLMPHIVIPLDPNLTEEVHAALSQILPEEPQTEPLPDRIMRRLGF